MRSRGPLRAPQRGTVAVWLLGLSQIIGYGTLYYAYAILAPEMARTFDWPLPWIFAALSLALLAGGIVSPFAGRCLDRYGSARVMACGSVAAAGALLLIASAPTGAVLVAGVVALQLCSPFVEYNAAFAYLAESEGQAAPRRIVHLTLIAGFASTLFWPLTDSLLTVLDWRSILVFYAGLNLFVAMPVHLALRRLQRRSAERGAQTIAPAAVGDDTALPLHVQGQALWMVVIGFALSGFLFSAISTQMVPLLASLGIGTASVMVAALFGPAQVFVRFANLAGGAGRHPIEATLAACAVLPVAAVVLAATAPATAGAAAFAILLGFGSGLTSIVRGTLPLALFGRSGYGARLGKISSAQLVSSAAAPVVLSSLIELFGPGPALGLIAAIGAAGFLVFLGVARLRRQSVAA
ncbi:MFS transporter [Aureimonas sp. SA4125]|uniref:arsenite efflux MFS transporter ArsK n=1 Tax=Aureimonas sp. SA4125 TaxID=2826993 RepID=UPI001CC456F8|nr:arsenite efflux MFS transporter ArsK [Aureimonas sp. SA4125]BDA83613.1 MFS transporter [Aureimonas sp. SA4125]